jgi:hypothetical protein
MHILSQWIRRHAIRTLAVAAVALVGIATPALHAQSEFCKARINVPFAFVYSRVHFAPGLYTVARRGDRVMIVSSRDGAHSATALIQPEMNMKPELPGKAVFQWTNGAYNLQELWLSGDGEYVHTIRSRARRQVELGAAQAPRPEVDLALLPAPTAGRR